MRSLMFVGAAALMLLLAAAPARADWCGQSMEGTTTCGFETQQQCRAAMTGLHEAAREVREKGTFTYLDRLIDVNKFMRR